MLHSAEKIDGSWQCFQLTAAFLSRHSVLAASDARAGARASDASADGAALSAVTNPSRRYPDAPYEPITDVAALLSEVPRQLRR